MATCLKQEPKMACPACGAANRLGAFVCSRCGARIYGDGKNPPLIKLKTIGGPRSAIRNTILSALGVFLCVSLLLALWPFPPVGDGTGRPEEVVNALLIIERQLEAGEAVVPHILREGDLNRYFAGNEIAGKQMKVDVSTGRLVLIAAEAIGPFTLGSRVVLARDTRTGAVSVQSAWVGHLPLPRSAAKGMVQGLARRFRYELPETLWTEVAVLRLNAGSILVGAPVPSEGP